ncbi:hypothetical protein CHCC5022_0079 [Bacillus paralicheniformis]|nr:hypothetical protein CHCC5027_0853 [Bacillus paralicheniformis]TWJ63949.1 hypothetical protein CHCC5022_0079 [Bacillus paralicheniformis]TWJ82645.1 hypothetical protein CHCC4186_4322 [Bacillus paralicheniformis]
MNQRFIYSFFAASFIQTEKGLSTQQNSLISLDQAVLFYSAASLNLDAA